MIRSLLVFLWGTPHSCLCGLQGRARQFCCVASGRRPLRVCGFRFPRPRMLVAMVHGCHVRSVRYGRGEVGVGGPNPVEVAARCGGPAGTAAAAPH